MGVWFFLKSYLGDGDFSRKANVYVGVGGSGSFAIFSTVRKFVSFDVIFDW
jgi:hypothetical protein